MIEVLYRDGLGNRLFQYCFGRILAESLGWRLQCKGIDGFPGTECPVLGESFSAPTVLYGPRAVVDLQAVIADRSPRKIIVNGWLQQYRYYRAHSAAIRRWLQPVPARAGAFPIAGPDDLVLHFRIGSDYESRRWVLHPKFYMRILESTDRFDKIYICYDLQKQPTRAMRDACLAPFSRFKPYIFESNDAMTDFNFVRQFRNIAIAPSTFCWWAAYLSNAERIFFPDLRNSRTACWGDRNRLEVDESRYTYLPATTLWD